MDDPSDLGRQATDPDNPFTSVPVEVVVSVGKARPLVRDLVQLSENSILTLDRKVSDPVELYVGDRLIAKGELEEMDGESRGQLAVRLTEIAAPPKGL
ncbi:MAG: FliM/FliN family flagellar motor switch protein [Rhodobiaceae bacterium]|jgi:flagellar motor switch protein FliN/FliY|nr:FliM/FliN family flagellar motor switch protein [Rhodobiaceae bacterium]